MFLQEEEKEDSCKVKPALPSETFVYQDLPEGCAECLCRQMRPLITYSPPKHGKPLSEIFSDVRKSLRRAGFPSGNYLSKQNSTATSSTKTSLSGLQTSASISHYREEELLVNELADSRNSLEREKPSNKIDLSKEESLLLHHDHLESWRSNLFNSRKLLGKNELPQKRSVPKKNGLVSSEFGKDMKLDRNRSTTYAEDFTINEKTSCDSINLDVLPDNIDLDSDLNDLISSMPDIGIVSNSRDECAFGKNRNISGSDSESRSGHSLSKEKSKAKDFYSGDSCSTDAILHSQKQQSLLFSSVIDSFSEKKDNWTLDSGSSVKIQTKQSNTLPNSSLQLRKDHYHTSAVRSDRPLNHSAAPTTAKSCKGDTNDRLFPQNASFGSSNSRPANKVSVPSNGQEIEYQCQSKKLSARFGNSSVFIDNSSPNSFTRNRTKIDKEKESSNFRTESVRSTITRQDQTRVYGTNEYHKASSSLFSQNSSKGLTMHKHESFRHNDQKVSSILPQASASKHSEVNAPKQVFKPVISENYANSMRGPSKGLYTSGTKYKHVKPAYPTAKHSISDKYSSSHNIKSKTICPSYQPNSRLDFNTSTSLLKTGVKGDSKPLCTSFSGNQDSSGSISKKQNTLYGVASKNDENDTGRLLEQCPVCMMNFPLRYVREILSYRHRNGFKT